MYDRTLLMAMVQGIVVCDQLHIGHYKAIMVRHGQKCLTAYVVLNPQGKDNAICT